MTDPVEAAEPESEQRDGGEPTRDDPYFVAATGEDVLEIERANTTWLSSGWQGGRTTADAAYVLTVPADWRCEDVSGFVDERLRDRGVDADRASAAANGDAPVLLTGVDVRHARGARLGPVEAYATAGVSNPAALPTDPDALHARSTEGDDGSLPDGEYVPGTVNVVVGTTRDLAPGALANLVAIAAEARATTLLERVGVPGTTSDAVVAACDPAGDPAAFSGSATRVGAAARACVRDAVGAALDARYSDDDPPESVSEAPYGVSTTVRADVFEP